jgi:hypothetical protein
MGFGKQGAFSGGMSGMQLGMNPAAIAATGGWSPYIGAAAGALAGGLIDSGGDVGQPDLSGAYNLWRGRLSQIGSFQQALSNASTQYINSYNNFQQYQFGQNMINNIPYFASKGKQVDGGAYSAEAARQASFYANQGITNAYNTQRQDAQWVDNAYAGAFTGVENAFGQGGLNAFSAQNQANQMYGEGWGSTINALTRQGPSGEPSMLERGVTSLSNSYGSWRNKATGSYPGNASMDWGGNKLGLISTGASMPQMTGGDGFGGRSFNKVEGW